MTLAELNNLWIGDTLKIVHTNTIGSFEGKIGTKAKIKINGLIAEFPINEVELVHTENEWPDIKWDEIKESPSHKINPQKIEFENKIDLHFESLEKWIPYNVNHHILDYQINVCRLFLEYSIQQKKQFVTIIHGKGEGTLKKRVILLLKEYPEIKHSLSHPQSGSTDVIFS